MNQSKNICIMQSGQRTAEVLHRKMRMICSLY